MGLSIHGLESEFSKESRIQSWLLGTHVNNAVHSGCGDDAVAAQVEVNHPLERVGDAVFWHTLIQEENNSSHVVQVIIQVI